MWILLIMVEAEETELQGGRIRSAHCDLRKRGSPLSGRRRSVKKTCTVYLISRPKCGVHTSCGWISAANTGRREVIATTGWPMESYWFGSRCCWLLGVFFFLPLLIQSNWILPSWRNYCDALKWQSVCQTITADTVVQSGFKEVVWMLVKLYFKLLEGLWIITEIMRIIDSIWLAEVYFWTFFKQFQIYVLKVLV